MTDSDLIHLSFLSLHDHILPHSPHCPRESTCLPPTSLHFSAPLPVTQQWHPGISWSLAAMPERPFSCSNVLQSQWASGCRSFVPRGHLLLCLVCRRGGKIPVVFLPKEVLYKLYFTSFRFRNLRQNTKRPCNRPAKIPIPSCAFPGDIAGKAQRRDGNKTQVKLELLHTSRIEL